jgi:hypothetical protein
MFCFKILGRKVFLELWHGMVALEFSIDFTLHHFFNFYDTDKLPLDVPVLAWTQADVGLFIGPCKGGHQLYLPPAPGPVNSSIDFFLFLFLWGYCFWWISFDETHFIYYILHFTSKTFYLFHFTFIVYIFCFFLFSDFSNRYWIISKRWHFFVNKQQQ